MLGGTLDEVIDSFIPWKEISKAYFQAKSAPVKQETVQSAQIDTVQAPKPALSFGESETVEFETEGEEEDEERPRLTLGEDVKLDIEEEDEEPAAKPEGVLKLDL
jgi:hypothetical protein